MGNAQFLALLHRVAELLPALRAGLPEGILSVFAAEFGAAAETAQPQGDDPQFKAGLRPGAAVKQGQTLATCGKTTVAEMRIGTVPIDPLQVWRGQCDALKYY